MGIFLLIGVLCSLSSLSSSSTLQPITAALHSPESLISHPRLPQHSINYWKSLLCLAELRSARYTKSSFVLLFACFGPACSVISSTPFCLHSLVSGQIKKTQTCPTQELSACPVTCPSLSPSTNPRFSAASCRGGCSCQYFLLSFSISQKNLPAAPPSKLFLFQTQGFSAVCADLCNSM